MYEDEDVTVYFAIYNHEGDDPERLYDDYSLTETLRVYFDRENKYAENPHIVVEIWEAEYGEGSKYIADVNTRDILPTPYI